MPSWAQSPLGSQSGVNPKPQILITGTVLKNKGVVMKGGCSYDLLDDQGLHITIESKDGKKKKEVLEVDSVIICAGQEPLRGMEEELEAAGLSVHLVGGADVASELDAKRAIDQATRLSLVIEDATGKVSYEAPSSMTSKMMDAFGK